MRWWCRLRWRSRLRWRCRFRRRWRGPPANRLPGPAPEGGGRTVDRCCLRGHAWRLLMGEARTPRGDSPSRLGEGGAGMREACLGARDGSRECPSEQVGAGDSCLGPWASGGDHDRPGDRAENQGRSRDHACSPAPRHRRSPAPRSHPRALAKGWPSLPRLLHRLGDDIRLRRRLDDVLEHRRFFAPEVGRGAGGVTARGIVDLYLGRPRRPPERD